MDAYAKAIRDTPAELVRELARYGGLNPFGKPHWRVTLAQNVLDQTFGVMRHMPCVSADSDVTDIEPDRVETGEFWSPRYPGRGWILERWFPASAWDAFEWRQQMAEDGRRMMGEFPRHGDYFMVSTDFLEKMPPAGYWKNEIQKELRRMAAMPGDPALHLSNTLYASRVREEQRYEGYLDEVNAIHRQVTDPMLATVSRTAQRIRDGIAGQIGLEGNLAAG